MVGLAFMNNLAHEHLLFVLLSTFSTGQVSRPGYGAACNPPRVAEISAAGQADPKNLDKVAAYFAIRSRFFNFLLFG